jgi:hypothetical protein
MRSKGSLPDWTREDLEFVVPNIPTFDPETQRPITYNDSNCVIFPATIEIDDPNIHTWFGWGVDSAQTIISGSFSNQQVIVRARVVVKSVPCIMVRVGFSVNTLWTPDASL